MKKFSNYQYVPGTPMSKRDEQEVGSKFWNEGKWENFVAPFLPNDVSEMTLTDLGCNAGLFLKSAKERGFRNVIGVDADKQAVEKGLRYRDELGLDYEIRLQDVRKCLPSLPVSDYLVMANLHYYLNISEWLDFYDQLRSKARYVIIVTADKRKNPPLASAEPEVIRQYFKEWEEIIGPDVPLEGDPYPRRLYGLCFKNPDMDRLQIDELDLANNQQGDFYSQLDSGVHLYKTDYFRRMKTYRIKEHHWSLDRVKRFFKDKAKLWEQVKTQSLLKPIIINKDKRVVDGNHRAKMMQALGYQTVPVRRVP